MMSQPCPRSALRVARPRAWRALGVFAAFSLVACSPAATTPDDARPGDAAAAPRDTADPPLDARVDEDAPLDAGADSGSCACFDGDGAYCERDVAARAATAGCAALDARADGDRLFACSGGRWTVSATCAAGCAAGETGADAACQLPVCDCFVRSAWCGAGAARHGLTLDPPCRVPLAEEHDGDLLGCDGATWVVQQRCAMGCVEAPVGTPDTCRTDRTPADPGWAPCARAPLLYRGLHPEASDRLRCAGVTADRITQTVGYASASAGYHAPDGTVDGMAYTAAVDLSTRGMSETQIRELLTRLGRNGFAAWYRKPGFDGWPAGEAPHIHGVFAGVVMKAALRGQVRDFLVGRNGLASHTPYRFWTPTADILAIVRLLYSRHYTP